jgi:hypothetical protein
MLKTLRLRWGNEPYIADQILSFYHPKEKSTMPTNLEVYQLLKDEAESLEQHIADLAKIADRCVSNLTDSEIRSQCRVMDVRLDKVRAMLKRFKVLYRIKQEYRYLLGLNRNEEGFPYFEKSGETGDYYAIVKDGQRPLYTIQGFAPEHFEVCVVEES